MGELDILAFRIKQLRESKQMTQMEFSKYIGISQQTFSGYERGIMRPPLDTAKLIAERFNVSIDWLCGLTDEMSYNEEIKNYADMFQLAIKLCEIPFGGWSMSYEESDAFTGGHPDIAKLTNANDYVVEFFQDWEQIHKLYKHNTIDRNLYNLWLSDKLKYYKEISIDEFQFRAGPALQNEQ